MFVCVCKVCCQTEAVTSEVRAKTRSRRSIFGWLWYPKPPKTCTRNKQCGWGYCCIIDSTMVRRRKRRVNLPVTKGECVSLGSIGEREHVFFCFCFIVVVIIIIIIISSSSSSSSIFCYIIVITIIITIFFYFIIFFFFVAFFFFFFDVCVLLHHLNSCSSCFVCCRFSYRSFSWPVLSTADYVGGPDAAPQSSQSFSVRFIMSTACQQLVSSLLCGWTTS